MNCIFCRIEDKKSATAEYIFGGESVCYKHLLRLSNKDWLELNKINWQNILKSPPRDNINPQE